MLLPDLAELLSLRAAAHGLDLRAHRPALARLQGGHRSAQRGRGLEFEEVRLYAPGDDVRSIDWRVTARRGRPHTKVFAEDRERAVWLLADLHPGLFFGSRRQLKSALLLRAAAVLGWAASLGGDRLGAVIVNGREAPRVLAPRARQGGILPMLEQLVEAQPQAPVAAVPPTLASLLDTALGVAKSGSLVLLLSDFAGLDEAAERSLAGLAGRCDCRLLRLTDPLEASGLPSGSFRVGVPGRSWWLEGGNSRLRWREAWSARSARIENLAASLNVPLTALSTADAVADSLPPLLREPTWAA